MKDVNVAMHGTQFTPATGASDSMNYEMRIESTVSDVVSKGCNTIHWELRWPKIGAKDTNNKIPMTKRARDLFRYMIKNGIGMKQGLGCKYFVVPKPVTKGRKLSGMILDEAESIASNGHSRPAPAWEDADSYMESLGENVGHYETDEWETL